MEAAFFVKKRGDLKDRGLWEGVHTFGKVDGIGGFVSDGDVRDVCQVGDRNGSVGHSHML